MIDNNFVETLAIEHANGLDCLSEEEYWQEVEEFIRDYCYERGL
jgi:hypothetical protein